MHYIMKRNGGILKMKKLIVSEVIIPKGRFFDDSEAAARRKKIAEQLRKGQSVAVENDTGRMTNEDDKNVDKTNSLNAPKGKLA